MSRYHDDIKEIQDKITGLSWYSALFITSKEFMDYFEGTKNSFEFFSEIMLMGHFDNTFTVIAEEFYPGLERCKVRVISHGFVRNDPENANRRSLEALADLGFEIKVNVDVHARMFLGYNREHPKISELLLGSFDFNRDGISRRKYNAGIRTRNEDLVQEAVAFFENIWEMKRSVPLKDYIK